LDFREKKFDCECGLWCPNFAFSMLSKDREREKGKERKTEEW
jgi:hypothetical protein